ncbi:MAG: glutathione S-transferase family protein [Actinobacteria bacterium]|nr:glutathione S-transferase family protein [Thermoleophilia bacterium]MCB9011336.1 glutathione S-transferase family protein [Actinomycetota bacterium]
MLLYENEQSGNCYKVRLVLAYLGVDYERRQLEVNDRSNRREVLGHLNPALRVPTLVLDDGRALPESNAIIWYLAQDTALVPSDPFVHAQMLQWMFFEQYDHEPAIAVVRYMRHISGRPEDFADRLPELERKGYAVLDAMEGHLADRVYFVGDGLTLADVALYAYTHVAPEGGFSLDAYPAIRRWLARVADQPGHVPIDA